MSRGDSLTRQLKLWMLLLEDRELSVETAAVRLDCTRRTIYRDLEVLQRAGMPLYQETAGRRVRWRLMEGFHRELSVQFSVQEAMALVAGEQFLAALRGTVFAEAAQSAVGKVRQALAPALRQRLELISRHVSATGAPTRALGDHRAHLDALLEAIEHTQVVELEYRKLNSTRAEHYTFEPHHVHVQGSSVYVVGWVIERAAPRVFLLDRVEAVKPTTKKLTRRPEIGPGLFSQGAFGLWDGKVARVRLKFRGTAATIVEEQQFHASQRTERQADGSLLLELAVPPSPSLKAWVRGFGKRVEVLEPKDLLAEP